MTDRAVAAVLAVLSAGAEAKARVRGDVSTISIGRQRLTTCWIGEGHLRDARRFLEIGPDRSAIAVARALSPGAIEAIREAGLGFVDENGAAEIAAGSVVVSRTGIDVRPKDSPRRWVGSVFSVAEALLCGVEPKVHACADATGLSVGAATNALAALVDFGLLESDQARGPRSGRRLQNPKALLDAYQAAVATSRPKADGWRLHAFPPSQRVHWRLGWRIFGWLLGLGCMSISLCWVCAVRKLPSISARSLRE